MSHTFYLMIPLLNIFYTANRYIIICHPSNISKFCTKWKTVSCIVAIMVISGVAPIHELYDTNLILAYTPVALAELGKRSHEYVTGIIVILLLLIKGLIIFVASLVLTSKMNRALSQNIQFLLLLIRKAPLQLLVFIYYESEMN